MTDGDGASRLTPRQRKFCELYVENGGNGKQAATDAGYSARTAKEQASRLLTNVHIVKYIIDLRDRAETVKVKSIIQTKAFLSAMIDDETVADGVRVNAARILLQSSGAFFAQNATAEVNVYSSDSDTIIYLPQLQTEEECLFQEEDDQ